MNKICTAGPHHSNIFYSQKISKDTERKIHHKKNVLLLLKVIPPSLRTSSALMKTLWCWEASFWLPAEQMGKSEWAVNCLQLASTSESVDVTWSLQQTPVTRCYSDGNEATSGSADKFMLQKKSPFLPGSLSRRLSLCPSCTSVLSVWVKWELLKGKPYKADDRGPARENSEVAPGVDDYYHYDSPEGWWTLLVLVCRPAAKTMLIGGEKDAVFMGKWQPVQSNQVVLT